MTDVYESPLPFLASSVRNASEASALVDVDLLYKRHEVLHDHLLACCTRERDLLRTQSALMRRADGNPQLLAAAALCASLLKSIRANIDLIVSEVEEVLSALSKSARGIQQFAEANEALAGELAEAGGAPALADAKKRAWLVEASLVHRMDTMLDTLRARLNQAEGCECTGQQTPV